MDTGHLLQPQFFHYRFQEAHPLLQGIHQSQLEVRPIYLQGQPREACPGAYIYDSAACREQSRLQGRQAVHHMLHRHLLGLGDGGEVHLLIPLDQHFIVAGELLQLVIIQL